MNMQRTGERTARPFTKADEPDWGPADAEIASYIADLATEMGEMAAKTKLQVLAYFLAMARVEAEMIARK